MQLLTVMLTEKETKRKTSYHITQYITLDEPKVSKHIHSDIQRASLLAFNQLALTERISDQLRLLELQKQ